VSFRSPLVLFSAFSLLSLCQICHAQAPEGVQKLPERKTEPTVAAPEPQLPAQIELLETHVRFETNGDSRKEVHTRVRINNELGVQHFARLNFNFNRAFESIEIPFVRVTHASGGTADILPSAITDNPDPAVVNFPAYQDVRVKSVRILGLEPGDLLEYRVITTVSHHPLAPDFWLDHTFDRSGVVSYEIFELDLPGSLYFDSKFPPGCNLEWMFAWDGISRLKVCGSVPYSSPSQSSSASAASRSLLHWDVDMTSANLPDVTVPDIMVSTLDVGVSLVERLAAAFSVKPEDQRELQLHLQTVAPSPRTSDPTLEDAYDFVSQKLRTVDLPVGATGFRLRAAKDVLESGYATPEEKCMLLAAFARSLRQVSRSARANPKATIDTQIVFLASRQLAEEPLRPSVLEQPLVVISDRKKQLALDPSLEVSPFAFIGPRFRGKPALSLTLVDAGEYLVPHWIELPLVLPFPAFQRVNIAASLTAEGALAAKVTYSMRGDNELLLRVAFHQSPKEKWKDLAQLLAISDGFRGKVTNVSVSDPYATHEPFTVEYEITTPKFVDWSKKPVRIPALLPHVALPDPPAKPAAGAAVSPIELGTPLDVETRATLHLPPGTTVQLPTGASVARDYATFSSKYSANGSTISASRRVNFLLREVPAARLADYNAFLRAVQTDQAQEFTLERVESAPAKQSSPGPAAAASPAAPEKP